MAFDPGETLSDSVTRVTRRLSGIQTIRTGTENYVHLITGMFRTMSRIKRNEMCYNIIEW